MIDITDGYEPEKSNFHNKEKEKVKMLHGRIKMYDLRWWMFREVRINLEGFSESKIILESVINLQGFGEQSNMQVCHAYEWIINFIMIYRRGSPKDCYSFIVHHTS